MRWITRERVKVDRVACPWLIRKFVDSQAEFIFLPADTDWPQISDGIVYDVPNCELGHHGEDVSFDSIIKKYRLDDPALHLLAEIVRAADSRPAQPHPAGEGLRWIAHGFSALGLTDHEILNREFVVYDALYAECRRRTGTAE
jgi:hypothetical protein